MRQSIEGPIGVKPCHGPRVMAPVSWLAQACHPRLFFALSSKDVDWPAYAAAKAGHDKRDWFLVDKGESISLNRPISVPDRYC